MNKILLILCFLLGVAVSVLSFPDGVMAVALLAFVSFITIAIINRSSLNTEFLIRIFLIALLLRTALGFIVYFFELRGFFGNDATLYDLAGYKLYQLWFENASTGASDYITQKTINFGDSGWGMPYLVGVIYTIFGRNILAAQFFCIGIGAATAPLVYACAHKIFKNSQVSRISAILTACFPAFVVWSCQLLKDGLMIFLLVLAVTLVLELQQKLNYSYAILLILTTFCILSLRFYIFYMIVAATVGSFIIGSSDSQQSAIKRVALVAIIGLGLTYFGALGSASKNIDQYANLQRIQSSRSDLATSAESGFGQDADVSTTDGAFSALPIGLTYLMLAPFPWQVANLRQSIVLPEILVWWAMIPFLIIGLIYTVKLRLRNSVAILVFVPMLMVGYALFLGNVGTAYRQRTQIQVFLFMFVAAGWTVRKERQENKAQLENTKQKNFRRK